MIPVSFIKKAAFILDLADSFSVDGYILGKRLSFPYSKDIYFSIIIPSIIQTGRGYKVGVPGVLKEYGMDMNSWGELRGYHRINEVETIKVWISSVLIECFVSDPSQEIASSFVLETSKQLVHRLHIIRPEAIRDHKGKSDCDICRVSSSVFFDNEGHKVEVLELVGYLDMSIDRLRFTDIKKGIQCFNQAVSAPFEMLDNARINLSHRDTRAAVLNCATAVEIMMKKKISKFLDTVTLSAELKDYVLRQADGYSRQVALCKNFSLGLSSAMSDVQASVVDVRNRVIHGGYVPTFQEAKNAYEVSRTLMIEQKVSMFETGE